MCKSLVYAVNSQTQTVTANGTINFGSAVRRFGCNCDEVSGNAVVKGVGYYLIDASVCLVGTGAGTVTVTLYKDGVTIPGAVSSATLADGTTYEMVIPQCVIRQQCCMVSTITAVISVNGANVSNATIRVVKI